MRFNLTKTPFNWIEEYIIIYIYIININIFKKQKKIKKESSHKDIRETNRDKNQNRFRDIFIVACFPIIYNNPKRRKFLNLSQIIASSESFQ